jgi:WD40 repeat protein
MFEATVLPTAPGTTSGTAWIWAQDLDGGEPRRVFTLPTSGTQVDVLSDGKIVLDQISPRQNLRATPIIGPGSVGPARWLSRGVSTDRQPSFSPDGRWVAFSSGRNGNIDIWKIDMATGEERRLSETPGTTWDPAFTPDGRIVFSSNRTGHFEIWKAEADGSHPEAVTHLNQDCQNPNVSGDGRWIDFVQIDAKQRIGIWRIHPDGTGLEYVNDRTGAFSRQRVARPVPRGWRNFSFPN